MRGLKISCIVLSAFLLIGFDNLLVHDKIHFSLINLVFLLISPAGYICESRFLYGILAASWSLFIPIFIFRYHIDIVNAASAVLVFSLLLKAFAKFRDMFEKTRSEWGRALKERTAVKERTQGEYGRLVNGEDVIRNRELAIANLYEITKRISASLKFEEIFDIFNAFLKENFRFGKSELFILKEREDILRIDRKYEVLGDESDKNRKDAIDYEELVHFFVDNKKELYLTKAKDGAMFKRLRIGGAVESFVAIPLLSENKMVGILTVEDLLYIDFERFAILAMQFSLEIKKVLLYETVEELAITDGLTGLYVRRYFLERMNEELNRSRRYGLRCAFLMIDIDNFKNCNDTYGHLVGDVALKEIALTMKQSVREIDLVARYGGEEFSLLLPETDLGGARFVAERIRKKIEENVFTAYDEKLNVKVSIGVSAYPENSKDVEGLIEKADSALYKAKRSGKNIVCIYGT